MPDPLRHVRVLAGEIGPRGATSAGETRAARYIAEAARGFTHQVWLEPFRSTSSPAPAWLFALGLSLLGGVTLWVHPPVGAVLATVGAVSFAGQAAGWIDLGRLFPQRSSQNAIAVVPAREAIRRRLVLVAHYDTGVLWPWPALPRHERLGSVLVAAASAGLGAFSLLYAVTGHRLWAWLALLPLVLVAAGAAAVGARLWRGRPDDRADAGAGGAAVALSAGEALARVPLRHTEVWFAFTGCREPGMAGVGALLDRYRSLLADATFLVLDRFGGGPLAYTRSEGWMVTPTEVAELLAKVAASHPEWDLQAVTLRHCRTQAFPLVDRQLHAAALLTADVDEGPATLRPVVLHQGARLVRAVAEELDRRACAEAEQEEPW
ncbi:MAG TPA: hypothetical protein VK464_11210 [Symbiobacteriaceae bacterium]|nr:hypothetical protein [Symbiobacteriaceae bacterium]